MKRNSKTYKTFNLYLELGELQEIHNLSDPDYIALEWLYNLTAKSTKMLEDGLDALTGYTKIRKYLKQVKDVDIPSLNNMNQQKVNYFHSLYDSLESKGLIERMPDIFYRNQMTGTKHRRRMYEFSSICFKKENTYTNDTNSLF